MTLTLLLLVVAFILAIISLFYEPPRFSLLPVALILTIAALLLGQVH
jgi:hypothetical protein